MTNQASSLSSSAGKSSPPAASQNKPRRRAVPVLFQGGRCTFGGSSDTLAQREKHAPMAITGNDPTSAWGAQERDKLNEICECDHSVVVVVVALGARFTLYMPSDMR